MAKRPTSALIQKVTIEGEEISVTYEELPIDRILLDSDNPRIREELRKLGKAGPFDQDQLREVTLQISGVSELQKTIRENKGLQEPIYVLADGTVLEGNCRTAIFKLLKDAKSNESCWKTIPALTLPSSVTPRQIAILRARYHVAGKIKWRTYAQAEELHKMNNDLGMQPGEIATALGLGEKEVILNLQTYEMMTKEVLPQITNGDGREKFSHILEFHKNLKLKEFRAKPEAAKIVAGLVASDKIKGAEIRELYKIVENPEAMKLLKKEGFKPAITHVGASDPTADSQIFRKLKATTKMLNAVKRPDLERIRSGTAEKEILEELFNTLKTVAETAGLKLK